MNQKFLFSISTLGLLAGISSNRAKAETYMCEPCPTGYYCSKGVKNTCPSDSLCINGHKIAKSSCERKKVTTIASGSGTYTLNPGLYELELAGGGGGGGGGCGSWSGTTCKHHGGCNGGKGGLKTSETLSISYSQLLTYSVGSGGSSGSNCKNGSSGSSTTYSITINGQKFSGSASGGGGGAAGHSDSSCAYNGTSYGEGGSAGKGGSSSSSLWDCSGDGNAKSGGTGWITIYQWVC